MSLQWGDQRCGRVGFFITRHNSLLHYLLLLFFFLPPKPPRNGKIVTQSHRHAAPRLMTNKWLTFYQMTISSCFDFTLQKKSQFCILSHHTLKTLSPFKSTLSDEWDQTAAASQAEGYTIIASMNRGCWHTRLHWSEWLGPCVHPTLWDLCCVSVLCLTFCQRFAVHPEIKGWRDKKRVSCWQTGLEIFYNFCYVK